MDEKDHRIHFLEFYKAAAYNIFGPYAADDIEMSIIEDYEKQHGKVPPEYDPREGD